MVTARKVIMKEKDQEDFDGHINEIKQKISGMNLICSGTLSRRKKTCGKQHCRCADDPDALHGPYHEWTRTENGKLIHRTLSKEQADKLERAIADYREIQSLLAEWRRLSTETILGMQKRR